MIKNDKMVENCLTCKVLGTLVLSGVSANMFYQRTQIPITQIGNRRFVTVLGFFFGAGAIYRWTMDD